MVGVAKGQPAAAAGNGGGEESGDGRVDTVV
jgi:hypothetical protein